MKSLLGNIDTAEDDLQIKFSLTKEELQKEINLRKEIVKLQKESILKHLISKTVSGVQEEELLHDKKKERLLRIPTVTLSYKHPRKLVAPQPAATKQPDSDESKELLKSVESQQQSIQSIMNALKGLADFKQTVQQEIGSIAKDISNIKGKGVGYSFNFER
jgi:hypothetical protein